MNIDDKNKRKRETVLKAVDEYIKTAQPITSGQLNLHFNDISSATIRNELNALESMGYFKQLHTSGGRIPTSLAYKEYVNSLLECDDLNYESIKKVISNLLLFNTFILLLNFIISKILFRVFCLNFFIPSISIIPSYFSKKH